MGGKKKPKLPKCDKRKLVDGIYMCFAIGCEKLGDMPCECEVCMREEGVKPSHCCLNVSR